MEPLPPASLRGADVKGRCLTMFPWHHRRAPRTAGPCVRVCACVSGGGRWFGAGGLRGDRTNMGLNKFMTEGNSNAVIQESSTHPRAET